MVAPSLIPGLHVGHEVRLFSEFHDSFMMSEGFSELECSLQPAKPNEMVFRIVSACESLPPPLYVEKDLLESERVDINFQKLTIYPRLLATELEQFTMSQEINERHEEMLNKLRAIISAEPRIASIGIAFDEGKFHPEKHFGFYLTRRGHPDKYREKQLDYNFTKLSWYQNPRKTQNAFWTDPYIDIHEGHVSTISYCVPIKEKDSGLFMGVIKMDIDLHSDLSKIFANSFSEEESKSLASSNDSDIALDINTFASNVALREYTTHAAAAVAKLEVCATAQLGDLFSVVLEDMLLVDSPHILAAYVACAPSQVSRLPGPLQKVNFEEVASRGGVGRVGRREKSYEVVTIITDPKRVPSECWVPTGPVLQILCDSAFARGGHWISLPNQHKADGLFGYVLPFNMHDSGGMNKPEKMGVVVVFVRVTRILEEVVQSTHAQSYDSITCKVCDVNTELCYYSNSVTTHKMHLCVRCYHLELLPHNTLAKDYEVVQSAQYAEWMEKYRLRKDICYGMHVQLLHLKSYKLLAVDLVDQLQPGKERQLYQVHCENLPRRDPYLEGTESTWFMVKPVDLSCSLGEKVKEGANVRLVAMRWNWELEFATFHSVRNDQRIMEIQQQALGMSNAPTSLLSSDRPRDQINVWKMLPYLVEPTEPAFPASAEPSAAPAVDEEVNSRRCITLFGDGVKSPFLRHGDLIYLQAFSSAYRLNVLSDLQVASSTFRTDWPFSMQEETEKLRQYATSQATRTTLDKTDDLQCKESSYGRYVYSTNLTQESDMSAVWKIEVVRIEETAASSYTQDVGHLVSFTTTVRLRNVLSHRHLCVGSFVSQQYVDEHGEAKEGRILTGASVQTVELQDVVNADDFLVEFQFVSPNVNREEGSLVRVDEPLYLKVAKPDSWASLGEFPATLNLSKKQEEMAMSPAKVQPADEETVRRGLWLNVDVKGCFFAAYRDEEDMISAVKASIPEQLAIYTSRQCVNEMEKFMGKVTTQLPKFMSEGEAAIHGTAVRAAALPNAAMRHSYLDDITQLDRNPPADELRKYARLEVLVQAVKPFAKDIKKLLKALKLLTEFVILQSSNPNVQVADILSNPKHELYLPANKCLQWRQRLLVKEHIMTRLITLCKLPLFIELVSYSSTIVDIGQATDENDADDLLAGLTKTQVLTDEQLRVSEERDAKNNIRELAISVVRKACELGCLLMVDFPAAALSVVSVNQGINDHLTFLLSMVAPSAFHRLGVQRWLALMFENGRNLTSTLTLSPSHLDMLLDKVWLALMEERFKLDRRYNKEVMRGGSTDRWKKLVSEDAECAKSIKNFVRLLRSLTIYSRKCPDFKNQQLLLACLLRRCEKIQQKRNSVTNEQSYYSNKTGGEGGEVVQNIPTFVDLTPTLLSVVVHLSNGAHFSGGHGLTQPSLSALLAEALGLQELDLSSEGLLACAQNAELSSEVRSLYLQLLVNLYVRPKYAVQMVQDSVFIPAHFKQPLRPAHAASVRSIEKGHVPATVGSVVPAVSSLSIGHSVTIQQNEELVQKFASIESVSPPAMASIEKLWAFVLNYFVQSGRKSSENVLTVQMLELVMVLLSLQPPKSDLVCKEGEPLGSDKDKLFCNGSGSKLKRLADIAMTLLKRQQARMENGKLLSGTTWLRNKQYGHMVRVLASDILDLLMSMRVLMRKVLYSTRIAQALREGSPHNLSLSPSNVALAIKSREGEGKDGDVSLFAADTIHLGSPGVYLGPILLRIIANDTDQSLTHSAFSLLWRQFKQQLEFEKSLKSCTFLFHPSEAAVRDSVNRIVTNIKALLQGEFQNLRAIDMDLPFFMQKLPVVCELLTLLHQELACRNKSSFAGDGHRCRDQALVQDVYRTVGVHSMLLSILHMPVSLRNEQVKSLFELCYSILELFCDDHVKNKRQLVKHLDFFFEQCQYCAFSTKLLTVIVGGNYELCVKLNEGMLDKYLHLLVNNNVKIMEASSSPTAAVSSPPSSNGVPPNSLPVTLPESSIPLSPLPWTHTEAPMNFLRSIVRVNDRMIPHIQTRVLKLICGNENVMLDLARMHENDGMDRLIKVLNFIPASLNSGQDNNKGSLTAAALLQTSGKLASKSSQPSSSLSVAEERMLGLQKYYIALIATLSQCAPYTYVYINDSAKRESVEGALMCQKALPIASLVRLICSMKSVATKAILVNCVTQIYSGDFARVHDRWLVRMLHDFEQSFHNALVHCKTKFVANQSPFVVTNEDNSRQGDVIAQQCPLIYVLHNVAALLVGFYDTNAEHSSVSEKQLLGSQKLFDVVLDLAACCSAPEQQKKYLPSLSTIAMFDNLLSLIVQMSDPSGKGVDTFFFLDKVNSAYKNPENVLAIINRLKAVIKEHKAAIGYDSHFTEVSRMQSSGQKKVAVSRKSSLTTMERKGNNKVVPIVEGMEHNNRQGAEKTLTLPIAQDEQMIRRQIRQLVRGSPVLDASMGGKGKKQEDDKSFLKFVLHCSLPNSSLQKTIRLMGTFAADEYGQVHKSGHHWIDSNSSKFVVGYLGLLQAFTQKEQQSLQPGEEPATVDEVNEATAQALPPNISTVVYSSSPRIIIDLFSRTSSVKISLTSLLLSISFLSEKEQMKAVQASFYNALYRLEPAKRSMFFLKLRHHLNPEAAVLLTIEEAALQDKRAIDSANDKSKTWEMYHTTLRFIQLLCEGHNLKWQSALLDQASFDCDLTTGNAGTTRFGGRGKGGKMSEGVSVNVVVACSNLFGKLMDNRGAMWYVLVYWDSKYTPKAIRTSLQVFNQLLNTIIELLQSDTVLIAIEFCENQLITHLDWVFDAALTFYEKDVDIFGNNDELNPHEELLALQDTIINCLLSLLEGYTRSPKVIERLLFSLNFTTVRRLLDIYLSKISTAVTPVKMAMRALREGFGSKCPAEVTDGLQELCVKYYIFVTALIAKYNVISKLNRGKNMPPFPDSFIHFLNSHTLEKLRKLCEGVVVMIEVLRDDQLDTVVFKIPRHVHLQSLTNKFVEMKQNAILSVRRENQNSKIDDFRRESNELVHELTSWPRMKQSFLVLSYGPLLNVTFFLAVVLNGLDLYTSDLDADLDNIYSLRKINEALTGIQLACTIVRTVSYLWVSWPNAYFRFSKEVEEADQIETRDLVASHPVVKKKESGLAKQLGKRVWDMCVFIVTFMWSPMVFYHLAYLAISVWGGFTPKAHSFQLLDITHRSVLLKTVFKSLKSYAYSLLSTVVLWMIIVLCFATLGYHYFQDDINGNENIPNGCSTKMKCFLFMLSEGLRAGGGIGDVIMPNDWDTTTSAHYEYRLLFDMLFFFICVVIMLSVVSGIIIDSFGASRDFQAEVNEDQTSRCFICGLESSCFDVEQGFEWHWKHEHNMWNYVYFQAYLSEKEQTEFTSTEQYVYDQMQKDEFSWFPMGRAIMIENRNQDATAEG